MGTKTQTQSTLNYNPAAMDAYNANISSIMPVLRDYATNPYGNSFFNLNRSMLSNQAAGLGQTNMNSLMSNLKTSGLGDRAGFAQSLIGQSGRATSGLQANANWQAMQQALAQQNFSLGTLSSFQPLMTGSNTTQQTSGLGTWLPQLAGAALGGLTGGLGSSLMGGMFGGGGGGASASSASNFTGSFGGGNFMPQMNPFNFGAMNFQTPASMFTPGNFNFTPSGIGSYHP